MSDFRAALWEAEMRAEARRQDMEQEVSSLAVPVLPAIVADPMATCPKCGGMFKERGLKRHAWSCERGTEP